MLVLKPEAAIRHTQSPDNLHLTFCNSKKTWKVSHEVMSWPQLVEFFGGSRLRVDRDSLEWPLFVPFKMKREEDGAIMSASPHGTKHYSRCQQNVEFMSMLVLDIDNDPSKGLPYMSIENAKESLRDYTCLLYTSFNHLNPEKHNVEKFRVLLPLLEAVGLEDVKSRKDALRKLFPSVDPASFTASQPFYFPICHPDRLKTCRRWVNEGRRFDLLEIEPKMKVERKAEPLTILDDIIPSAYGALIPTKMGVMSAVQLYDMLQEGYEHRVSCYRKDDPSDKHPGCFIFKRADHLEYYGQDGQWVENIPVRQVAKQDYKLHFPAKWKPVDRSMLKKKEPKEVDYVELNEKYLPKEELVTRLRMRGIAIIKSPKGTGKTEIMAAVCKDARRKGESVMLLGHRVFLLKNLASRTRLKYYLESTVLNVDNKTGLSKTSFVMAKRIAICMNSLTRMNAAKPEKYNTLILDESEQVLLHLASKTMKNELTKVFNMLVHLIRSADRIICLDADLSSQLTLEVIMRLRGDQPEDEILGVNNHYQIGQRKTTKLYFDKHQLIHDALRDISQGEKVFITSNHKGLVTTIDAAVKAMGKKSLLVTADTNGQKEVRSFIEMPSKYCKQYDAVLCSPTLSTGVSIDGEYFTRVYGIFNSQPGTFQDVDQAISRVRKCNDVRVWIQSNKNEPKEISEQSIFNDNLKREQGTRKVLPMDKPSLTDGEWMWCHIVTRLQYMERVWSSNKLKDFIALRRGLGFEFAFMPIIPEQIAAAKEVMKEYKRIGPDFALDIWNANELDHEDAKSLSKKQQKTRDEFLQVKRHEYKSLLKDTFDLETLREAIRQDLIDTLYRLRRLVFDDDQVRINKDMADRRYNKDTFTANEHRVKQEELVRWLAMEAGIDCKRLLDSTEEDEIAVTALELVAKAFESRRQDFNRYFELRIRKPTDPMNLVKVWNATFGLIALPLVKKKKGPRGEQVPHYFINRKKVHLVQQVSQRIFQKSQNG